MPDINMQVFEEAKRNQLVTEIDIQTQAALDDYQVQLSDIANPTQSQDNVVIDRCGEFLPHWNESLDFDTWVKMSMEVAGKKLLMLRGNSNVNSASSIENTMIFGDDFSIGSDIDSRWTKVSVTTSIINDIAHIENTAAHGGIRSTNAISLTEGIIIESRFRQYDVDTVHSIGFFGRSDASSWWDAVDGNSVHIYYHDAAIYRYIFNNGNHENNALQTPEDENWHRCYIYAEVGQYPKYKLDAVEQSASSYTVNSATYYLWMLKAYTTNNKESYCDWVFIRKFISTEPTHNTGTEQNVVVALKSLGRAG